MSISDELADEMDAELTGCHWCGQDHDEADCPRKPEVEFACCRAEWASLCEHRKAARQPLVEADPPAYGVLIWLIRHEDVDPIDGEKLYWSMHGGWASLGSALIYTEAEQKEFTLPNHGEWIPFVEVPM